MSTRACSTTFRQDRGPGIGARVRRSADRAAVLRHSLWQLVSALLVGGCTVLIEQGPHLPTSLATSTACRRLRTSPGGAVVPWRSCCPPWTRTAEPLDLHTVSTTGEALKATYC
ncbi:hypothetical protein HBB16_16675 [Pseudonocardia sp. MCCB 268]|nr:hypothetical protein [Pseudonocardia cytotoxica]